MCTYSKTQINHDWYQESIAFCLSMQNLHLYYIFNSIHNFPKSFIFLPVDASTDLSEWFVQCRIFASILVQYKMFKIQSYSFVNKKLFWTLCCCQYSEHLLLMTWSHQRSCQGGVECDYVISNLDCVWLDRKGSWVADTHYLWSSS